jgi:hypothetical protein
VEETERRRQLLQALTTEHFTLQTARSATIADSNGRSALYLATVSGAVVALAFIGQVDRLGRAFYLFALALLPALVLLGVLTYLRLVQTAVEDLFYARAINRIRRHYVDLDPDGARWFVVCGFDDPAGMLAAMGLATPGSAAPSHGHVWPHAATMVAVVTSMIAGVGAALAANAVGAGRVPVVASATLAWWSRWPARPGSGGIRCAAGGPPRPASPACLPPSQPPTRARPTADHQQPLRSAPAASEDAAGATDQGMVSAASVRGCPAHGGRLSGGWPW